MIKSVTDRFGFPWVAVIVLFIISIGFSILSFPLKNLIRNSLFIWVIYDQIPWFIVIVYAFLNKYYLIRSFSFRIEFRTSYRYLLFLMIVTGLVFLLNSIASLFKTSLALLQLINIDILTRNFSFLFYIKALLFAPVFEEFVFRGLLLNDFLNRYSPTRAIFIAAIIFSLIHINPGQYFVTLSLGLLNGWYFYKTRNLLSCIIIHSLNNFISITLIKYFVDKMHSQVITVDTQIIQFDNVLLFIFLSLSLIIVGFFYLFKSIILEPSAKSLNT